MRAKFRSDEQKLNVWCPDEDEVAKQAEVQYCTDQSGIDGADTWDEGCHSYLGRSADEPDWESVNTAIS